jgi:hypothetical protein
MEDEFESLRKKSTRSSTIYEEMEAEDSGGAGGLGGFIARLSPGQRMLLSFLVFINILALGCGCLVLTGVINF